MIWWKWKFSWGDKGLSFFLLSDIGAMDSSFSKSTLAYFNKKFVLKRWHPGMSLSRSCIKVAAQKVPPWVQFFNLPMEFWRTGLGLWVMLQVQWEYPLKYDKVDCLRLGRGYVLQESVWKLVLKWGVGEGIWYPMQKMGIGLTECRITMDTSKMFTRLEIISY